MLRRRLTGPHAWQSAANYSQQFLAVVSGIVLARVLAPADFGQYGLAFAMTALSLLPASWSLAAVLVTDANRTPSLLGTVLGVTWLIVVARLLLVALLTGILWWRGDHALAGLCLMIGVPESARELSNVLRGSLEGRGHFHPNLAQVMTEGVCSLVVIVLAARAGWGSYALGLGSWIGVGCGLAIYRGFSGASLRGRWDPARVRQHVASGFWLWLNTLADTAVMRFDKWLVGHRAGDVALGLYTRAFSYAPASHLVLNALMTNPTVVSLRNAADGAHRRRVLARCAVLVLGGGLMNAALLVAWADPVVPWVFGPQWVPAVPYFEAFAGLSFCLGLTYLPTALLLAMGDYRALALIRLAGTALLVATALQWSGGDARGVAVLLQSILAVQGFVLLARGVRYLR